MIIIIIIFNICQLYEEEKYFSHLYFWQAETLPPSLCKSSRSCKEGLACGPCSWKLSLTTSSLPLLYPGTLVTEAPRLSCNLLTHAT